MSDETTRANRAVKIYRASTDRSPVQIYRAKGHTRSGMVSRQRDAEARQTVRSYTGSRYGA